MTENDPNKFKFFGFEISRTKKEKKEESQLKALVPSTDPEESGYTTSGSGHFASHINMDADNSKHYFELINQYRGVAMHPEVDVAIDEIVNEAINTNDERSSVEISLDGVETTDNVKKKIKEEFENIVALLKFNEMGYDIFRSFYIDGRLYYQILIDEKNVKAGIKDIRHMDSAKTRKVKNVIYKTDQISGVKTVSEVEEYFVYEEKPGRQSKAPRLSPDSVAFVSSGLMDSSRKKVVSYLHKALKTINQLRMMEDSLVIYRLSRAPERRIFYIDIGNLPKGKAESYMTDIMAKYRNKLVYDADTGKMKDDRKHMTMLEDFFLPRREGGRGTEISTLPGGENLGQIDDVVYFQKKLYKSLNVPFSRLEQESQFNLGRSNEITRDEIKFQKFIDRIRRKFSNLFLNLLKKQLLLKGICTETDWNEWKDSIFFDFIRDNHFSELKEMEIIRERVGLMNEVTSYVGEYYSKMWVMKNVMKLSDEEIEDMKSQIEDEEKSGEIEDKTDEGEDEKSSESEPVPTPVTVVEPPKEKEKEKNESTDINNADEMLNEELAKYMRKLNNNE